METLFNDVYFKLATLLSSMIRPYVLLFISEMEMTILSIIGSHIKVSLTEGRRLYVPFVFFSWRPS